MLSVVGVMNLLVVLSVNVGYILVYKYSDNKTSQAAQIVFAFFKIGWNNFVLLKALKLIESMRPMFPYAATYHTAMVVLNNILLPCLATAIIKVYTMIHVSIIIIYTRFNYFDRGKSLDCFIFYLMFNDENEAWMLFVYVAESPNCLHTILRLFLHSGGCSE